VVGGGGIPAVFPDLPRRAPEITQRGGLFISLKRYERVPGYARGVSPKRYERVQVMLKA
jgi:hypothetical protein